MKIACVNGVVHNGAAYICLDEVGINDNKTLTLLDNGKSGLVMLKDAIRSIKESNRLYLHLHSHGQTSCH